MAIVKGLAGLSAVVLGFAAGSLTSDDSPTPKKDTATIEQILNANTAVLEEIGRAAEKLEKNSDLMMRYSHFTDDHSQRKLLCPECWPAASDEGVVIPEDPPKEVPQTMGQLLRDSQELRMGVQRINASLNNQQFTLSRHLKRLKKTAEKQQRGSDTP